MSYDPTYLEFVLEQLRSMLPAVNSRPMFGGVGIYSQGIFFALIAADVLYFHVDEASLPEYTALGMRQFGKNYYELPVSVLEDSEQLQQWSSRAVAAAKNKKKVRKL